MRIRPVPLDQVVAGRDGRQYLVTGEAGRIAQRLAEIDDTLVVYFNEFDDTGYFIVAQVIPLGPKKGEESVVMRVPMADWDERVIKEWELRAWEMRNGIDPTIRIEKQMDEARRAADARLEAEVGERAYDLMRSFQRGLLGTNPRVFIPSKRKKAQQPQPAAA